MKTLSFKTNKKDQELIEKIAKKAVDNFGGDYLETMMDITACHANGCPLRLQEMLDAPMGDFGHDVNGIARYINRETGEIGGFFLPRFFDSNA